MAIINCPECNKEISNKAQNCPNCGFPVLGGSKPQPPPKIIVKKGEGCFLQTLNIGCATIIIIVAFVVISSLLFKNKYQKSYNQKNESKNIINNNPKGGSR